MRNFKGDEIAWMGRESDQGSTAGHGRLRGFQNASLQRRIKQYTAVSAMEMT